MLAHDGFAIETFEKTNLKQSQVMWINDLEPITEREKLMIETAYRRGYYQGWWFCYKAFDEGAKPSSVQKFIFGRLFKWRLKRHGGKLAVPPEF